MLGIRVVYGVDLDDETLTSKTLTMVINIIINRTGLRNQLAKIWDPSWCVRKCLGAPGGAFHPVGSTWAPETF